MKLKAYEDRLAVVCSPTLLRRLKAAKKVVEEEGVLKSKLPVVFEEEDVDDVDSWIDQYRSLWKGKKPGSMGDRPSCIRKMNEFMNMYPEFADRELILKAAKAYIDSLQGDYRYIRRAHYFIFKRDETVKKTNESQLAAFCEEVKMGYSSDDSSFEIRI